jgi:hypothetical protein
MLNLHPEDIWNGDETGLFWKMKPFRVLARTPIYRVIRKKNLVLQYFAVPMQLVLKK